jgi:cytochrome P450
MAIVSLTIRRPQMAALSDASERLWLRKEIEALYPAECESMGVPDVVRFVQESRARAQALKFTTAEFLSFLALELCFGEKFLDSPEHAWARKALSQSTTGTAADRMERLRHAAFYRLAEGIEQERRQQNVYLDAQETAGITP